MNSEFTAKLEGIKLNDQARQRIVNGVQELVIRELAHVDHKGDLIVKRPIELRPILNGIIAREVAGHIEVAGIH